MVASKFPLLQHKFNPLPKKLRRTRLYPLQDAHKHNHQQLFRARRHRSSRIFFFLLQVVHQIVFQEKAPAIPSGTLVAYEILPIGVKERHNDVKERMFRGCLVGVDLQRRRERMIEEFICCFVLEDLVGDWSLYKLRYYDVVARK